MEVSALDADRLAQNLVLLEALDIGCRKWEEQHQTLERLNIQAHRNVQNESEEYVTEALKTFDKLYHEATLINLLEIVIYSPEACLSVQDCLGDLIDYCSLVSNNRNHSKWPEQTTKEDILQDNEENKLARNADEIEFACAIHAISVLRCVTNSVCDLSVALKSRLLKTTDMICALVYLIENAPWLIRSESGQYKRFEGGVWIPIQKPDLQVVGKVEGQVWLALLNLVMDADCRKVYEYSTHNWNIVMRLRPYMTEVLLDQLPPLVDVKRYLEELSMMEPPETATLSSFGIEELSSLSNRIESIDWNQVLMFHQKMLSKPADMKELAERFANMYDTDDFDTLLSDPKCSACGEHATQRCSRCKSEWYCGRACQVKSWKGHKSVCDILSKDVKKTGSSPSSLVLA